MCTSVFLPFAPPRHWQSFHSSGYYYFSFGWSGLFLTCRGRDEVTPFYKKTSTVFLPQVDIATSWWFVLGPLNRLFHVNTLELLGTYAATLVHEDSSLISPRRDITVQNSFTKRLRSIPKCCP